MVKYRLLRDNGRIDPEARKHLFELTTKPGEQGLGLGLTLSASSRARHRRQPGRGTSGQWWYRLVPTCHWWALNELSRHEYTKPKTHRS